MSDDSDNFKNEVLSTNQISTDDTEATSVDTVTQHSYDENAEKLIDEIPKDQVSTSDTEDASAKKFVDTVAQCSDDENAEKPLDEILEDIISFDDQSSTDNAKAALAKESFGTAVQHSYEDNVEKLLDEMPQKIFSFSLMDTIVGKETYAVEAGAISFSTFCKAADCLVTACIEVDIRVRENYLNVFKRLFFMVNDFNDAMRYVYELAHFREAPGSVPDLRNYYKNFEADMTMVVNGLTELNTFALNPKLDYLSRTLAFLLMIAPKPAIRQLLVFMIQSKPLWPSVILLLDKIPAFFKLRISYAKAKVECNDVLIITLFRRLLNVEKDVVSMEKATDRDMFQSLLLSFTRTQLRLENGKYTVTKRPLLSATDLLRDFVMDYLSQSVHIHFFLDVLNRLCVVNEERKWIIDWQDCDAEINQGDLKVHPYQLISLLIEIYAENESDSEIRRLIPTVMKSLANKFRADDVLLSSKSDLVLEKLEKLDWSLRFCVCGWLEASLDMTKTKIPIPSVLYISLAQSCRSKYNPIESAMDCSETENFIRSVFELALTSLNEAVDFIKNNEFILLPTRVYSPMIAEALLRSVRIHTSAELLMKLRPLVDALFSLLDVPIKQRCGNFWTERMFEAMRKLSPVLVFFDALHIYINENLESGVEFLNTDELGHDAKIFLETFTQNVISLINEELVQFRTCTITFRTEEFGSHTESQLLAAVNQISILYRAMSFLAEKLQPVPALVKLLKTELFMLAKQLQNKIYPPYSEDICRYRQPSQSSWHLSSGLATTELEAKPESLKASAPENSEVKPPTEGGKDDWRRKGGGKPPREWGSGKKKAQRRNGNNKRFENAAGGNLRANAHTSHQTSRNTRRRSASGKEKAAGGSSGAFLT